MPASTQTTSKSSASGKPRKIDSFRFLPSQPFAYAAGQHVDVRLTAPDGYTAQRSYSIASAPEAGDEIELAIEKLDDGEVSPYLTDELRPGECDCPHLQRAAPPAAPRLCPDCGHVLTAKQQATGLHWCQPRPERDTP